MAISIFDAYETDLSAEEGGKWFTDFLGEGSGADIKIRRASSRAAQKVYQSLVVENRKHFKKGKFPPEIERDMEAAHTARGLIVDWRGVVDKDGNDIKFDAETAQELLLKLPNFMRDVRAIANSIDAFRAETQEDIAGN